MKDIATKAVMTVAAVAALALGGSAMASAASSDTAAPAAATTTTTTATAAAPADIRGDGGPGARGGQRPGETLVTGSLEAKLTAAAKAKVPGATIDRVETDADGAAYEAHVTKSDGSQATVLFDKDGSVSSVETGMGPGGGAPQN